MDQLFTMEGFKIDTLSHSGIKGQKWGVRRWQNPDGSLTPAGREHYGVKAKKGQKAYLTPEIKKEHNKKIAKKALKITAAVAGTAAAVAAIPAGQKLVSDFLATHETTALDKLTGIEEEGTVWKNYKNPEAQARQEALKYDIETRAMSPKMKDLHDQMVTAQKMEYDVVTGNTSKENLKAFNRSKEYMDDYGAPYEPPHYKLGGAEEGYKGAAREQAIYSRIRESSKKHNWKVPPNLIEEAFPDIYDIKYNNPGLYTYLWNSVNSK